MCLPAVVLLIQSLQLLKQIYEDEFQRAAAQDGERTSLFLTPKTYLPGV